MAGQTDVAARVVGHPSLPSGLRKSQLRPIAMLEAAAAAAPAAASQAASQDRLSRPSRASSSCSGTSLLTSPPYLANSFTRLEDRNAYNGLVVMKSVSRSEERR